MKKLIILKLFLLSFGAVCARERGAVALVSGEWAKILPGKASLYKMVNGELTEIASFSTDDERRFYFACKPSPQGDFYFVGTDNSLRNLYAVYLKAGERIEFAIAEDSCQLGEECGAENRELSRWHNFMQPLKRKSFSPPKGKSTWRDFFPLLNEKLSVLETCPVVKTGNRHFDDLFEDYKRIDFAFAALSYLSVPRPETPQPSDFPDYYRNLEISGFTRTSALMNYPSGIDLIEKIAAIKAWSKGEPSSLTEDFLKRPEIIANDTIRGELLLKHLRTKRTYSDVVDFSEKYGKYLVTRKQQVGVLRMMNLLGEIKENEASSDFIFPDIDNKEIALSDFKGKVVYIDVWATWCGPCKTEIPVLKALEKQYHGNKDIVFIGVSIDSSKDFNKWKDFVVKENPGGIQLFAGDKAQKELMMPYKILSIPRFILIGKDGAIVSADAPRPSSPEIKSRLDSLLK
jgi:thiol-disulfide isomerase/thioredoxin